MQNFLTKAIFERVKLLRNQYAGKRGKSKFARALGISPSTYSYYEASRVPPIETLLKMCEVTGADLNWLLTGQKSPKSPISEPEKFAFAPNKEPTSRPYEKPTYRPKESISGLDRSLTARPRQEVQQGRFRQLGPEIGAAGGPGVSPSRKLDALLSENPDLAEPVLAFIELLWEKKNVEKEFGSKAAVARLSSEKTSPPRTGRPGWIPVLGRTAAGMIHFWDQTFLPEPQQAVTELDELVKRHIGKAIIGSMDGMVSVDLQARALVDGLKGKQANLVQVSGQEAEQIVEFIQCEGIYELFPDSFALRIDGDSMSPRINDDDIVILSSSVPAAQGQIGIARIANQIGVTCKLIRSTEKNVHLIPINESYETKVVSKKDLLWALAVLCHISV